MQQEASRSDPTVDPQTLVQHLLYRLAFKPQSRPWSTMRLTLVMQFAGEPDLALAQERLLQELAPVAKSASQESTAFQAPGVQAAFDDFWTKLRASALFTKHAQDLKDALAFMELLELDALEAEAPISRPVYMQ